MARGKRRLAAFLIGLALLASACGDDDESADASGDNPDCTVEGGIDASPAARVRAELTEFAIDPSPAVVDAGAVRFE
ncbi:MAG TPA: hypothetical protein VF183_09690, partial [Acidimicrobiales bacterium]